MIQVVKLQWPCFLLILGFCALEPNSLPYHDPRVFIWYAQQGVSIILLRQQACYRLGRYPCNQVGVAELFENLGQWFEKGSQVSRGPISTSTLINLRAVLRILLTRSGRSVLLLWWVIYWLLRIHGPVGTRMWWWSGYLVDRHGRRACLLVSRGWCRDGVDFFVIFVDFLVGETLFMELPSPIGD